MERTLEVSIFSMLESLLAGSILTFLGDVCFNYLAVVVDGFLGVFAASLFSC